MKICFQIKSVKTTKLHSREKRKKQPMILPGCDDQEPQQRPLSSRYPQRCEGSIHTTAVINSF